MTTTTTTQNWTEIISETTTARNAAKAGQVSLTGTTWSIIEGDTFRQASPDESAAIEAHFASMAAMMAEFGAGDFDLTEWTAQAPTFDANAEIEDASEFASAEATYSYGVACRFGFEM